MYFDYEEQRGLALFDPLKQLDAPLIALRQLR